MDCPWKVNNQEQTVSFAEILSEDYAHHLQDKENKRYEAKLKQRKEEKNNQPKPEIKSNENDEVTVTAECKADEPTTSQAVNKQNQKQVVNDNGEIWEDYTALLVDTDENQKVAVSDDSCNNDEYIARMLQSEFDHDYNEELKRIEQKRNKQSKIRISLDKFRRDGDWEYNNYNDDDDDAYEEDDDRHKRDWDRFETNEKKLETIPKCGFMLDEDGEMVTKHDPHLCGVRNACRVMSFPLHVSTGDAAGFEMSLSNKVYNQLKSYSHRRVYSHPDSKKNKMHNRKENMATAEMGVDARTRLLLYKLINKQLLEQINGIVSTGKEALILHANSDPNYVETEHVPQKKNSKKQTASETSSVAESDSVESQSQTQAQAKQLPKECAIKIFRTTLNEFKQRNRYIKDDFRFKDRFSSQDNFYIINLWAEKEMHNLNRMKAVGINCPDVITLKKHVLVMSFIGDNHNAAPKLKDARLTDAELSCAYEEIISAMYKMYNEAKLVHADLSEYNILWYEDKCWFIDVAQSVEPEHPSALEFLLRDCGNIVNFFSKRGLPNVYTKEELFNHITSLSADTEVGLLERIHTRGASIQVATAPGQEDCPDEFKPLSYPFDLAWEKSQLKKNENKSSVVDNATQAMNVLNMNCGVEAAATDVLPNEKIEKTSFANIVAVGNCETTAKN